MVERIAEAKADLGPQTSDLGPQTEY